VIIDLPSTTSSAINKKMVDMREQGGANTQGRVLTLVIVTDEESSEDPIAAANGASFEHPCRVIVVARGSRRGAARLDAQIRVGGDAGASEVIVLRLWGALADHGAAVVIPLLLPDAPVVAWWPGEAPESPSEDPIGALAQRRITDSAAARRPLATLAVRRASYRPGDTDLAWTRLTSWRGLLAAALDQPPHEKITEATVAGASDSASADLLAGWLALRLRCPVRRIKVDRAGSGLRSVTLTRRSGEISLVRPEGVTATLSVTNQAPRELTLPRRLLRDIIAEELRRLHADEVYADVLSKGLDLVAKQAGSDGPGTGAGATGRRASRGASGGRKPVLEVVSKATSAAGPTVTSPATGKPGSGKVPAKEAAQ
jgi:glucose-6-phosphate dehydrogenase assembly protein OpcA